MISRRFQQRRRGRIGSRRQRKKHRGIRLFFFLLAFLLPLDWFTRPILNEALALQGKRVVSLALAGQAEAVLEEWALSYSDITRIGRDETGNIVSVETDTFQVNRLKSQLESRVTAVLSAMEQHEFSIPLGTLFNSPLLNGRGPEIPLRVGPAGVLHTDLESRFESAGINQTSHQIYLTLSVEATGFIPLHQADCSVTTQFLLAETVIVGEIPQQYLQISPSSGGWLSALEETKG